MLAALRGSFAEAIELTARPHAIAGAVKIVRSEGARAGLVVKS